MRIEFFLLLYILRGTAKENLQSKRFKSMIYTANVIENFIKGKLLKLNL